MQVWLSAEGAKNVSWHRLSPLRGWASLTMALWHFILLVNLYVCVCVFVCVYIYIYIYICMYICGMYVYIYAYIHIYKYIYPLHTSRHQAYTRVFHTSIPLLWKQPSIKLKLTKKWTWKLVPHHPTQLLRPTFYFLVLHVPIYSKSSSI